MKTYQKFVNEMIHLQINKKYDINVLDNNIFTYLGISKVLKELKDKYKEDIINSGIEVSYDESIEILKYISDNMTDKIIPFINDGGSIILLYPDDELDMANEKKILHYYNYNSTYGKINKYNQIKIYNRGDKNIPVYKSKTLYFAVSLCNDIIGDSKHYESSYWELTSENQKIEVIDLFQKIIFKVIDKNYGILQHNHIMKLVNEIGLTDEIRQKYPTFFEMRDNSFN